MFIEWTITGNVYIDILEHYVFLQIEGDNALSLIFQQGCPLHYSLKIYKTGFRTNPLVRLILFLGLHKFYYSVITPKDFYRWKHVNKNSVFLKSYDLSHKNCHSWCHSCQNCILWTMQHNPAYIDGKELLIRHL